MSIKVNFSSEEMDSEFVKYEPIPTGEYTVSIFNIEEKECGPESKNPGKPYWNVQFKVIDGEFTGRSVFSNVMLFNGALYSLVNLLKATGHVDALKTGIVPAPNELIGTKIGAYVKRMRDKYAEDREGSEIPIFKNEVKGFLPFNEMNNGGLPY